MLRSPPPSAYTLILPGTLDEIFIFKNKYKNNKGKNHIPPLNLQGVKIFASQ